MQCSARSVGGIGREKGGMGQKIHGEGESEKERERERGVSCPWNERCQPCGVGLL